MRRFPLDQPASCSVVLLMIFYEYGKWWTDCNCLIWRGRGRVTTCLENLEMSGNYTDFRNFTKSRGNVREKILPWKIAQKLGTRRVHNLCYGSYVVEMRTGDCVTFIIFHYSVAVDGTGLYDVIIMKSLSVNMNLTVWSLTLTLVVQAWYEYRLKWSGVPQIIREFHSAWRVVTL